MRKSWVADAAIGLVLTLVVAVSYVLPPLLPTLEGIELWSFDKRSQLRTTLEGADEVVLISIDDASIESGGGRWPWPRSKIAALIDKLAAAEPKVIGLDIVYSESENQMLGELQALEGRYKELSASKKLVDKGGFGQELAATIERLDSDAKLLGAMKRSGKVVLPMYFGQGGLLGAAPKELPASISSSVLSMQVLQGAPTTMPDGTKPVAPISAFSEAAAGIGHVNVEPDFDGVVRRESPVLAYNGTAVPSYALQLALAYLGVDPQDAVFVPGDKVQLAKSAIPLDAQSRMILTFNGPDQTFRYFSYQDVMNDKVAMEAFKGKIVIVGLTATGVGTLYVTPVAHNFPAVELVANAIENILHSRYLVRPEWAGRTEWGAIGLVGVYLMLVLPRLRALWGFLASFVIFAGLVGAGVHLFINGQWLKIAYPCSLLAGGYLLVVTKRFFSTEKGKELVEAGAIDTNKMLGLSFQGQGLLDLAFDKFRLCPAEMIKDELYNLALDFERKRQFAKAASVLEHLSLKDPKYKDCADKIKMLKAASDGAVFGNIGGAKKEGTVMIAGGAAKPTLGRYEIEKELGRGAMGIVYLGKDPKINRMVAIKTMVLEDGSDAASTKEIKERFFREAESAGTLNHPNIVRIFDAGEENEVAFIAMELLDGVDLTGHTAKDKLLPLLQTLEYVALVADALDYAHAQGIVHRDIKPANIMLLKDGTIRVADFGIARITASSKTATGTVMGTPSYMSPEQIAGKKVDGRSDLFSLAVALFELLTGEKPFKGGEGIGTLLFQIANDPHPDPIAINPALPPCLKGVIDKGLAKKPDERYPRGGALAADLRACIKAIESGQPGAVVATGPVPAPESSEPPAPVAAASAPLPAIELPGTPISPAPVEPGSPADETLQFLAANMAVPAEALAVEPPAVEPLAEIPAVAPISSEPAMSIELGARNDLSASPELPARQPEAEKTMRLSAADIAALGAAVAPPAPAPVPAADPDATIRLAPPPPREGNG